MNGNHFAPGRASSLAPLAFLSLLLTVPATAQDMKELKADLRSKDMPTKLSAIDQIGASGDKTAERTLLPLLKNKDWEVQERVARALGVIKGASSLKKLVDAAIDGPIVRVRRAAALSAGAIDGATAARDLFKKAKGDNLVKALESLALILRSGAKFSSADKLREHISDPTSLVHEAAAVAYLEASQDRGKAIGQLAESPYIALRCRVLDAITEAPRAGDTKAVAELFGGKGQNEVVARRIVRALASCLAIAEGDRAANAVKVLDGCGESEITLRRRAMIVPLLASGRKPVFEPKQAVKALSVCLSASDDDTRALAAKSLREIGGEDALKAALRQFERERSARPQWQLIETVNRLREPKTEEAAKWLIAIAESAGNTSVREHAIVCLGRSGVPGATKTLVKALGDSEWTIAVCAAVSLGKTDADDAFAPLLKLLSHNDWKMRGAAVIGLMHWSRDGAVDPLIAALGDKNPLVSRAAHHALRTMSRKYDAPPSPKAWRAWWDANRKNHDFTDREATLDKLKKYGYAVPDTEIYRGLDVIVYTTDRGDHIEQLLDKLKIQYRTTKRDEVGSCGVHPEAIFVSNCTGELGEDDVEPLTWFVRTGGSLFGSCWALSETIARVHPDVMQQFPTGRQVLDDVRAGPCKPESQLLTGVFGPSVVPVYHLEGAHLIQVMDPARCEVLIDSPDAAERHGCGNLAAWFRSGHGVCYDSVNHFDLQGLGVAGVGKLRKPDQRQAYAIDHLGMSLATWREERKAKYWRSTTKSNEAVPDLSAFRLLTNFVRSKRIGN